MKSSGLESRKAQLKTENQLAITSFKKELDKFAFLVMGIRNQIESFKNTPSAVDLQSLLAAQLNGMNFHDSIVISFLDTNHIFQYSVTSATINANTLTGKAVKSIRDTSEINRLNDLLNTDELRLSPPLNLVEGWVGIPLVFRHQINGQTIGYFAPIIDFKSIIDEIYDRPNSNQFVYKFSYNNDLIFDRYAVYDGSKIYNNLSDPNYYKNYTELSNSDFLENTFSHFEANFQIGTAYKDAYQLDRNQKLLLCSWYFIISILFLIIWLFVSWELKKRKELESQRDQLQLYNASLERFSFATSHDLKEPLRTIGSFSSLLNKRYKDKIDERGQEYLGYIVSSVKRMNTLLEDLLKYTNVVNNEPTKIEAIPFGLIIKEVKESLHLLINENNAQINIDDTFPNVFINKSQIHQVLQNLISNAIKFNDKESKIIYIGCEKQDDQIVFYVRDNGIGINKNLQHKVFESFQQLNKLDYDGSGLGLSICKTIIEQNNGQIWLVSEKGIGSTFYFSLPTS